MKTRQKGFIFWAPRILGIIMIFFLALFSLDVFGMSDDPWKVAQGFLIHNIPSFILILLLVISWRWEWIGAICYTLLGLTYYLSNPTEHWTAYAVISGPLILIGLLFLISWQRGRRNKTTGQSGESPAG